MITRLSLKNFTAFSSVDMEFAPHINVFIGANGTGKTHILKLLYSIQSSFHYKKDLEEKIVNVFMPADKEVWRLGRRLRGKFRADILSVCNGSDMTCSFSNHENGKFKKSGAWGDVGVPVYIPVKEFLSNAPGFRSIYKKFDIEFEEIYYDIVDMAYIPQARGPKGAKREKLLKCLAEAMNGKVERTDERFYLKNDEGRLELMLLAEGMRKLALIWLLIQNDSLLQGSTLYWDEPEANLNPTMMPILADIMLNLAKMGVQVFIATHNYALLKELELRKSKRDKILYYSLFRDGDAVSYDVSSEYDQITPNLIADEYKSIYEREVAQAMGLVQGGGDASRSRKKS